MEIFLVNAVKRLNVSKVILIVFLFLSTNKIYSQWSTDPTVNNPIHVGVRDQETPVIVSDGTGGSVIAWVDVTNAGEKDIYALRIDADGAVHTGWSPTGVAICTAVKAQYYPAIISDGFGGAIITWQDDRNTGSDIYAQRIDADGSIHTGWPADGTSICTATGNQTNPVLTTDGNGGAIISWIDVRLGVSQIQIYAQKVFDNGTTAWLVDGVRITGAISGAQDHPSIISDNNNGAIITWDDSRNGATNKDIFAQRIDTDGSIHSGWNAVYGITLCSAAQDQVIPSIVSDGIDGAIICWHDKRAGGSSYKIYAQRVDGNGSIHSGWTADGNQICTYASNQYYVKAASDGSNGAIFTWVDNRSSSNHVFAQRIDGSGAIPAGWDLANATAVCTDPWSTANFPEIISDGFGGVIITWYDNKNGSNDIFAQKVDGNGTLHSGWTATGTPICTASGSQIYPKLIRDGNGGAFVTWYDYRNGNYDIFASRVFIDGALPVELTSFKARMESGRVVLNWETATEINNYGFDVEKSFVIGQQSLVKWEKIGFVKGIGNSNSPKEYSFSDTTLYNGLVQYRLKQIDLDGNYKYYPNIAEVKCNITDIKNIELSKEFALLQNYPNPFNPTTKISFVIPSNDKGEISNVELTVFDILGNEIATLVNERKAPGYYEVEFNGSNLSTGVYIYKLRMDNFVSTKKLLLLK